MIQSHLICFMVNPPPRPQGFPDPFHMPPGHVGPHRPVQGHADGARQGQIHRRYPAQIDNLTVGDTDKPGGIQLLFQLIQPQTDSIDIPCRLAGHPLAVGVEPEEIPLRQQQLLLHCFLMTLILKNLLNTFMTAMSVFVLLQYMLYHLLMMSKLLNIYQMQLKKKKTKLFVFSLLKK